MREYQPGDLELINQYANYFFWKLLAEGFAGFDKDDLVDALQVAYVKCLRAHKGSDGAASFRTYCIAAFKAAALDFREELIERSQIFTRFDPEEGFEIEAKPVNHAEHFEIRDLLRQFKGVERIMVREMIHPSENYQKAAKAFCEKFRGFSETYRGEFNTRVFQSVYRLPERAVRTAYDNVREKVGKMFMLNPETIDVKALT